MPRSLTKPLGRCKGLLLLVIPAATAAAQPPPFDGSREALRKCVANAVTTAAVDHCETNWQSILLQRIGALNDAIANRLNARQRIAFEQNIQAWQAFVKHEKAMIELTTQQRRDGLGPQLRNGAVSQLYEQRERQLREHLHNLTATPSPTTR